MNSSFRNKQLFRAAQWIWAAFVFVVHVAPVDTERVNRFDFPFADKWIHGILFFLLAAISLLARDSKREMRSSILLVALACAFYGASLEWVQYSFTDERSGDMLDWLADLLGALTGLAAAALLEKYTSKWNPKY
jgi:VanZ family protein